MADETRVITVKRGTATQWANEIAPLEAGELGYDSTNKQYKGGDGSSAYVSLSRFAVESDTDYLMLEGDPA